MYTYNEIMNLPMKKAIEVCEDYVGQFLSPFFLTSYMYM